MYAYVEKPKENSFSTNRKESWVITNDVGQKKNNREHGEDGFVDNRTEAVARRKVQNMVDKGPPSVAQLKIQEITNNILSTIEPHQHLATVSGAQTQRKAESFTPLVNTPVIQYMTEKEMYETLKRLYKGEYKHLITQALTHIRARGPELAKLGALAKRLPFKNLNNEMEVIRELTVLVGSGPSFTNSLADESTAHLDVPQGMVMVGQSDMVTGLKTRGVGPCVAVGLLGQKGMYALAHFDSTTDVENSLDRMFKMIDGPQEAWVAGGLGKDGINLFTLISNYLKKNKVTLKLEYNTGMEKGDAIDVAMSFGKKGVVFNLIRLDKQIDRVEEARKIVNAGPSSLSMKFTVEQKLVELDKEIVRLETIVDALEKREITNRSEANEKINEVVRYLDIAITYLGAHDEAAPAIIDRAISLVKDSMGPLQTIK
jgi:hypothetical protein